MTQMRSGGINSGESGLASSHFLMCTPQLDRSEMFTELYRDEKKEEGDRGGHIMVFDNYAICGVVGLSIGLVLTVIFLPFYFANMETIFEQLSIDLASFSEEYIQKVFDKYGVNVDVQQEEVDGTKKDPDDPESK